jgi:hypothetical protein
MGEGEAGPSERMLWQDWLGLVQTGDEGGLPGGSGACETPCIRGTTQRPRRRGTECLDRQMAGVAPSEEPEL